MSFDIRWAGYGRGASSALRDWIADVKRTEPLRPVCVVVPTNYVGVATRRLLAGGALGPVGPRPGLAGITFLTVYRLAELLGAPALAAAGRRPVSTPVLAAAARRMLVGAPGCFAPVSAHPSTVEALVSVYRELSELEPDRLAALSTASSRAADVVRICRGARELLAPDWYDEKDLLDAATAQVARGSSLITDLGHVVLYLPQRCPQPAARLIRTLSQRETVGIIAAQTGDAAADEPILAVVDRLGARRPSTSETAGTPAVATAVVEVSDADEEVRAAVGRIISALRAGTPLERVALLYPHPQPYARLVAEHLDAAHIRWNGHTVRPLADRIAGRWLLDVLAIGDRGWTRSDVLSLVAGAPVVGAKGSRIRAPRWERVSRDAGIDRDLNSWSQRLQRFAAQQRRRAGALVDVDESPAWRAERHRRDADEADALRSFVETLAHRLADVDAAASWAQFAQHLRALLRDYLGGPRRRERWPEAERLAAEKVELALDRLAVLDAVEPDPSPYVFRSTLEAELGDDLGRTGRLGQGVLVGPLPAGLGLDLDVVVVLGLAEGVLPAAPREDSLLPDAERARARGDLPLAGERVALAHRHLLAALASSSGERILIVPRGDLRRSVERPPSRWLLGHAARMPGAADGRYELPGAADWLHRVPSFAASVTRCAFPSTPQEYRLRSLADQERCGGGVTDHRLARDDVALRLGTELVRARRSDRFTRFDGNLSALRAEIPSPSDPAAVTAPTRLERWARCPHQYLMYDVLGVRPPVAPEERVAMEPVAYGELVHRILEDWVAEFGKTLVAADEAWPVAAVQRLKEIAKEWCAVYDADGLVGHRLLWQRQRDRLLHDLERFPEEDRTRRTALGVRPIAVEHGFGIAGAAAPPVHVDLGDGRVVAFRGLIDRVDQGENGRVVVTDYKTGRFSPIPRDDLMARGTKLQLVAYALAATAHFGGEQAVRAEYWFVTTKGEFKQTGYEVDPSIIDTYRAVLANIVDGIEAGVFPAHPDQTSYGPVRCEFCDPDQGGTAGRYAEWERKRTDPLIGGYLALAEPGLVSQTDA